MLKQGYRDNMTIRLSRLAKRGLDQILKFTIETWGRDQWLKYYEGLVRSWQVLMVDVIEVCSQRDFARSITDGT